MSARNSTSDPFVFIVLRVYLATAICHLKVLQASLGCVCFFCLFVAAIGSFSDIACLTLCYFESARVSHANVNVFICSLQFSATGITARIKAPLDSKSNCRLATELARYLTPFTVVDFQKSSVLWQNTGAGHACFCRGDVYSAFPMSVFSVAFASFFILFKSPSSIFKHERDA